ncbi:MAG: LPS export ABC transporter permease LptF [Xanthobacteraceae bacterium]|nr:MAG: LPS export ABC transporter permease LptF [Xanthobacteraceae bacterium]
MALNDRYIIRTCLAAFVLILVSLTALVWVTEALRSIDLMTSEGQTLLVFVGITGLAIPMLMQVIAPIAITIAVAYVIHKLAVDSEIIVMNASGMRPWQVFRPFLMVAVIISLFVGFISAYLAPNGLRRIKHWGMEVTADVVANILQPKRFTAVGGGLTLRIGDRQPNGEMVGIFVDDRRNPKERISITAERGHVLKNERGTFLILDSGSLQRFEAGQRDPALVVFDRYAFDLSRFANIPQNVTYSRRERYLWELAFPEAGDPLQAQSPGDFRAELNDRLAAPLYPIAFVMITFALLGAPRTTRQSRFYSIALTIAAVSGLRVAGFACTVLAVNSVLGPAIQYALLAASCAASYWIISRGVIIEPPARLFEKAQALAARLFRRLAPA